MAYNKNTQLVKESSASTGKLLLQQQLWTKLQGTFFTPGADASAVSKQSALTFEERHSCCGCPYNTTLTHLAGVHQLSVPRTACPLQSSSTVVLASRSPKSSHGLATSVTARSKALLLVRRRSTSL
jgi:hypothetical protein